MVLYTEFTYGSQFSEEKKEQSVSCLLKYKTNTKGKFFGTPYSFLASNQLAIASSPRHILICGIFLAGPVETARQQRTTFILLLLQGTSIGLVQTNTGLLSLVDTNRVQYTFI